MEKVNQDNILEDYAKGLAVKEIAAKYSRSIKRIQQILKKAGINYNDKETIISKNELKRLVEEENLTDKQIIIKLGYPIEKFRSIKNLRKKWGISRQKDLTAEDIKSEMGKGLSVKQIADKYNRTEKRIKELCREYGISYRKTYTWLYLTDEEKEKAKGYIESGYSDKEIVVKLGHPEEKWTTIRQYRLNELNIKKKPANNTISEDFVKEELRNGKTRKEIADHLGVKEASVDAACQKWGIFKEQDFHIDKITEEIIQQEYLTDGKTDHQIDHNHNVPEGTTWAKRKKLEIERTYIWEKLNLPTKFTKEQKDLVYGSLLGDSSIEKGKYCETYIFNSAHSKKQHAYTDLKAKILGNFVSSCTIKKDGMKSVRTHNHPLFKELYEIYYPEQEDFKRILFPDQILDFFTLEMLVYWYLDDGDLGHRFTGGKGTTPTIGTIFRFNDSSKFIETLWRRFNLKISIRIPKSRKNPDWKIICIYPHQKLINLLHRLTPPCMEYKIPDKVSKNSTLKGKIASFENYYALEERTCPKTSKKFIIPWQKTNKYFPEKEDEEEDLI